MPSPLPAPEEKRAAVKDMFDRISGRYDLVNRVMTFGLDKRWRRRLVTQLQLANDSSVLDIACGTGDFCRILESSHMQPVGIDLSLGMLQNADVGSPVLQADGLALPFGDASFDGITCGFALRNVVDLADLFSECARVLRPGGRVGFLEVAQPESRILRTGHDFYFNKVVPKIGGILSDRAAYKYLPASAAYLPDHPELALLLESANFENITRETVGAGAAQLLTATKQ